MTRRGRSQTSAAPAARPERPRLHQAIVPFVVSTRTLAEWTLIPERRIRELLARHPEVPQSRAGHEILLSADAVQQLLDVLRVGASGAAPVDNSPPDDLESAADVLGLAGLRLAGGSR